MIPPPPENTTKSYLFLYQGTQLEIALGPQRQILVQQIAKELHKEMPWFHGKITRDGADEVMKNDKHRDGKFL